MAPHAQILIVDDVPDNIQVAMSLLREDSYEFSFANSGEKALSILQNDDAAFDLILLDIMMPGLDGYETCQRIKSQTQLKDIPIIFLTAKADVDSIARAFKVGGVDYVTKPFHAAELLARVRTHVQLYQTKKWLEKQNIDLETKSRFAQARLLSELENSQKELIWFLTELMESTSDETGKHIRRVAEISALLAKLHPTLSDTDADTLYHASPMHDIGKMTVPHEILHKPGKYTPEEFEVMKSHTTNAYKLLSGSKRKLIKSAAIIAYQHHEKWDGSGYPRGLKGSDIHIYGRIVALADVFDALTHQRCYKTAWTVDDAVAFIQEQRGFHFDPELVDLMISHLDQFADIVK
ncbi:MAG: two-component system response regulator [Methylophaga sp.]|uniref:HD domain-containing phosphohydrolase n=1 Tax=Methylophaga sp. UBA678 TaxID=1946901 RepID=UPI000C69E363|nr:HD domain-containing phosphohydrolase [Methylophaga sp. UBA678]MAX53576.1 two-component system response regulator [Methylophaga sp.]|tara:strand:- start:4407 stop:5456 length:1050 start_codon:yes stop_codon:yes gene_type:complete